MPSHSSEEGLVKIVFICVGSGVFLVTHSLRNMFRARKTSDTPTSKIASAPQGFVEIQGYAWPSREEAENLNKQECAYRKLRIEQLVRQGKSSSWVLVAEIGLTNPFYVIDETGGVLVEPEGFDLVLRAKTIGWKSITLDIRKMILDQASQVKQQRSLPDLEPGLFGGSYRCVESCLITGGPVLLQGNLQMRMGDAKELVSQGILNFVQILRKGPQTLRRKMDLDRDGTVTEDESRRGMYVTAEMSRMDVSVEVEQRIQLFGTVRKHNQYGSFIADCHQEFFLKRIGSWNLLKIIAGIALILGGIFMVLNKFQVNIW